CSDTKTAFGRDEYVPTSIKSAPSESIFSTRESISASLLYFPPSKKESGVKLRIPITLGEERLISFPLQLMVIFKTLSGQFAESVKEFNKNYYFWANLHQ